MTFQGNFKGVAETAARDVVYILGRQLGAYLRLSFFKLKGMTSTEKQFLRFKSIHLKRDRILCLNSTFVLICGYMLSVYPPAMVAGTQCSL